MIETVSSSIYVFHTRRKIIQLHSMSSWDLQGFYTLTPLLQEGKCWLLRGQKGVLLGGGDTNVGRECERLGSRSAHGCSSLGQIIVEDRIWEVIGTHWKKKRESFWPKKSRVIWGTKVRTGIPSNCIIFE